MHQPWVSGCFLFHVKVIPTGPHSNESFPPRHSEKITFRIWSELWMQREACIPLIFSLLIVVEPLCIHVCIQQVAHTVRKYWQARVVCCIPCFICSYLGSEKPQTWLKCEMSIWKSDVVPSVLLCCVSHSMQVSIYCHSLYKCICQCDSLKNLPCLSPQTWHPHLYTTWFLSRTISLWASGPPCCSSCVTWQYILKRTAQHPGAQEVSECVCVF